MSFDLSDDYQAFDFRETVSVKFIKHGGTDVDVVDISALRRPLTKRDRNHLGIGVDGIGLSWELFDTLLSGNEPKSGDVITDASSVVWIIRSADTLAAGETWRCLTEKKPA